jgi:hypothetical protein
MKCSRAISLVSAETIFALKWLMDRQNHCSNVVDDEIKGYGESSFTCSVQRLSSSSAFFRTLKTKKYKTKMLSTCLYGYEKESLTFERKE